MRRGWRLAIGGVLIAHGLAHALPGMRVLATAGAARWPAAVVWTFAMTGFVAAGMGALGAVPFRDRWRRLALAAATSSLWFFGLFWATGWALLGGAIDIAAVLALWAAPADGDGGGAAAPRRTRSGGSRRLAGGVANAAAAVGVGWLAANALALPWHTRWGSTDAELALPLPGDEPLSGPPTYWIQHAVTIAAPPERVWPWLAQLGTDRAGFYSHAWLENLFGIPVENADRLHPEWQDVETGGFVTAAPAGYLGFDEPLGWDVVLAVPDRVLVLDKWGAFVLMPAPDGTTRLIVRTRSAAPVTLGGLALAWFGLAVFEPAHFIMESGMLRGIRERAEQAEAELGAPHT